MSIVLRNAVLMVGGAVSLGLAGGSFVKSDMRLVPVEQRYARYEPPVEFELAHKPYPEDLTAPMVQEVGFNLEGEGAPSEAAAVEVEIVPAESIDSNGFVPAVDGASDGEALTFS